MDFRLDRSLPGVNVMSTGYRRILPPILLAAGAAALAYGAVFRTLPVVATVMVEKEEIILERPPAPRWDGPSTPGGPRQNMPAPPPRPKKVKTSKPQEQEQFHPERKVTRDVTVGGIARFQDGRLKFTYGPGESGPALCPT